MKRNLTTGLLLLILASGLSETSIAQTETVIDSPDNQTTDQKEVPTLFSHSDKGRFWLSGQMNFIFQTHPPFDAKYSGPHSLLAQYEKATSRLLTLYTGIQLNHTTDVLVDFESAGGQGISNALGVAGFTNLDVVRNPTLGSTPYIARLLVHHIFGLSDVQVRADRGPFSLARELPDRRVEVWAGKMSTADFFDVNSAGSDSHLQFMNWSVDNNGAFDYAADTRGYTYGVVATYQDRKWGVRFGEMLMPQIANGVDIEFNLRRAHAENAELEIRRSLLPRRSGIVRVLEYVNHANMGEYHEAIERYQEGESVTPDITDHRRLVRIKYGFGLNVEQELGKGLTAFARLGWNDGKTESFAYTEIDHTVAFGASARGTAWGRTHDRTGLVFVSNGLSPDHSEYLALGGVGFLLGDGGLTYGREKIVESYYRLHVWRGFSVGPDVQYVTNPGYNRDRGPVVVPGFRAHLEL